MPPNEGRGGNICIWIISLLFFLILAAGGMFLVLYIALPETEETVWFPMAGMTLVAIPWVFWIGTCIYRFFTTRGGDRPPPMDAASFGAVSSAKVAAARDSPVETPGGKRKVRFENATVDMGEVEDDDAAGGFPQERAAAGVPPAGEAVDVDGDSRTTRDGASVNSHESEVPLASSMS